MKQELRDAWVAALRSGDWKQGKYRLNLKGKYCCIGVLCEIADFEGPIAVPLGDDWRSSEEAPSYRYRMPGSRPGMYGPETSSPGMITNEMAEYLGLPEDYLFVLAGLNDQENKNFNEIADWIEENVEVE